MCFLVGGYTLLDLLVVMFCVDTSLFGLSLLLFYRFSCIVFGCLDFCACCGVCDCWFVNFVVYIVCVLCFVGVPWCLLTRVVSLLLRCLACVYVALRGFCIVASVGRCDGGSLLLLGLFCLLVCGW